ncbi:MAG TPA: hypothetical protein VGM19_12010 [Armatimonadota bacterium]|jgi:hypothetical protein
MKSTRTFLTLLALLALPLTYGLAQTAPRGEADFDSFWNRTIPSLAPWAADPVYAAAGRVTFTGMDGAACRATLALPSGSGSDDGAVLEVLDRPGTPAVAWGEARMTRLVTWVARPAGAAALSPAARTAEVLNLYQATNLLLAAPEVTPGRVGLYAEGAAAPSALLLAALRPADFAFLVLRDPVWEATSGDAPTPAALTTAAAIAALRVPVLLVVSDRQAPAVLPTWYAWEQFLSVPHREVAVPAASAVMDLGAWAEGSLAELAPADSSGALALLAATVDLGADLP